MSTPAITLPNTELAELCRRWHVARLSLFGSVLRPDFRSTSDVDILVEFEPGHVPGFFGLARLQRELEALVGGRAVDLLTPGALSPHIRDEILRTAELQYAA